MDEFCGKPFWDWNLTWYTGNNHAPDFTPCFEETVLAWIPCAFVWIFGLLSICSQLTSRAKPIPWNPLNITKCMVTILLVVVQFILLCRKFIAAQHETLYPVDYFTPAVRVASYGFILALILYDRWKGNRSSGVLFNFWFISSICEVFAFRTYILNSTKGVQDVFEFSIEMIFYPLVLAQLLLSCWADASSRFAALNEVEPCPEETASYLSKLVFGWFDNLAIKGYRKPLEYPDLWDLNHEDKSSYLYPMFEKYWERAKLKAGFPYSKKGQERNTKEDEVNCMLPSQTKKDKDKDVSIFPVLVRVFGPSFLFGSFLKVFQDVCMFVSPQILRLLIDFVSGNEEDWKGYFYAAIIFVTTIAQTIFLAQYFHRMFLIGMRVRAALVSIVYRKALVLSNSARNAATVGEIVNLMSVDVQRIQDLIPYSSFVWSGPFQITLSLYFLWQSLGPSVLAGVALMILMIPLNSFIASKLEKLQIVQMKYKDERVKLMNEMLSGIKVLKLYAWENSFQKQVLNIRDMELKILRKIALLNSGVGFIWQCTPFLVALVTFGTYVLIDERNVLTPQKAFVSLTLFNILSMPLAMFPMIISSLVQARVSLQRLNRFMNSEEIDRAAVVHDTNNPDPIVIEDSNFSWTLDSSALRNINLRVKDGSLCAVVGEVGCGKSSLLSALLGEMYKKSGNVNTKGKIAYVSQQAWIQNATVRDNVLFGSPQDLRKYDKIIEACALKPDIEILPAGDKTEIGEKGINLSGGQKQRISLARATYNNADIYLLDDPLSAVDSHVGKHIFEHVIGPNGILKKKTRVLVTHGITYLPQVDFIVVMNGGEITESGTYQELLDTKGAFSEFITRHLEQLDEDEDEESKIVQDIAELTGSEPREVLARQRSRISESESIGDNSVRRQSSVTSKDESKTTFRKTSATLSSITPALDAIQEGERLIQVEKTETGSVNWSIYTHYAKSVGLPNVFVVLLFYGLFEGFLVSSNLWLSAWSNEVPINGTQDIPKRNMYLGVYGGLGVGQVLAILVASVTLALGLLKASAILHSDMLKRIMRAPSWFFDTTPTGRIVNRFSKDVDACDLLLPDNLRDFLMCSFTVLSTIVVISYSTPLFVLVIVPIGVVYYLVQRFYVSTSRQLKRLESVSRSPIYSHFTETVTGCMTIRAFGVQERFILESEAKLDYNQRAYFPSVVSNRWLAVRLETIGNLIILFASLFAIIGRHSLTPGLVGLSVSYALQITQYLNWMVRMTSSVETNIVGVERIKEYSEIVQEAPAEIDNEKPSQAWPEKGEVQFDGYRTRYREGLDLVLRDITAKIEPAEKIGIVGRTGSGKSSLALGLFRLLEPAGGSITIDGKNTSNLGLQDLRSRLTIIPQDPVLFSGTLRMNLDPFEKYEDEDVWRALEFAHLKTFAKDLPHGLSYDIAEGGLNLSVGQRQLVCLARALLRKSKILVLDEATAQVDLGTDALIQETIRTEFKDSTVLTIAHRLNTIMDSTRVMVLERGEIREFDKPDVLLKNKHSLFYKMAQDAGIVS